MDIIITIPKNIKLEDYNKELLDVKEKNLELNFKVPFLPKKAIIGKSKVYVTHNNIIIGYMMLTGFKSNVKLTCETTSNNWDGNFIVRSGEFFKCDPVAYKGFQGFRYIDFETIAAK